MGLHVGDAVRFGIYSNAQIRMPDFGSARIRQYRVIRAKLAGIAASNTAVIRDESDEGNVPDNLFTPALTRTPLQCCVNYSQTGTGWERFPVYTYSKDTSSPSSCAGTCVVAWPLLISSGSPAIVGALSRSNLGTLMRSGGSSQLTYKGKPLYLNANEATAHVNGVFQPVGSGNGAKVNRGPFSRVTPPERLNDVRPDRSEAGRQMGQIAAGAMPAAISALIAGFSRNGRDGWGQDVQLGREISAWVGRAGLKGRTELKHGQNRRFSVQFALLVALS